MQSIQRALALREQECDPDHLEGAPVLDQPALLYQAQEKYSEAKAHLQRALAICEQDPDGAYLDTALMLNNPGLAFFKQNNYVEAT